LTPEGIDTPECVTVFDELHSSAINGSQQPNDDESFRTRGMWQISFGTNYRPTARAVLAPDQSSSKLESIGRTKLVNAEQPLSTLAHVFGRLNLVPAVTQIVQAREGLYALIKR
jgi:hypothetical protein